MCLVDVAVDAATRQQPAPTPGRENVTEALVAAILARAEIGAEKYGVRLETHNGRDALVDLFQEQLDAAQYTMQALMEWDEMEQELRALRQDVAFAEQQQRGMKAEVEAAHKAAAEMRKERDEALAERDAALREAGRQGKLAQVYQAIQSTKDNDARYAGALAQLRKTQAENKRLAEQADTARRHALTLEAENAELRRQLERALEMQMPTMRGTTIHKPVVPPLTVRTDILKQLAEKHGVAWKEADDGLG